jgi:hypothetical protein
MEEGESFVVKFELRLDAGINEFDAATFFIGLDSMREEALERTAEA